MVRHEWRQEGVMDSEKVVSDRDTSEAKGFLQWEF